MNAVGRTGEPEYTCNSDSFPDLRGLSAGRTVTLTRLLDYPRCLGRASWVRSGPPDDSGEHDHCSVHTIEDSVVEEMKPPFPRVTPPLTDSKPWIGSVGISRQVGQLLQERRLMAAREREKLSLGRLQEGELVGHQAKPAFRSTFRPGIRFSVVHRRSISR